MHVVIIGCGRVGARLAQILSSEGHNIVIVDKNPESFKRLGSAFNGITITGIGFDLDTLKKAGIERADALAAVTNGDNSNIMVSQIAKRIFNVPRVVSRVYDPYRAQIYKNFGINTISSTIIGANIIKNMLTQENYTYHLPVARDAAIIEFILKEELDGLKCTTFLEELGSKFAISAVIRKNHTHFLDRDFIFKKGDQVLGIAKLEAIGKIKEFFKLKQ